MVDDGGVFIDWMEELRGVEHSLLVLVFCFGCWCSSFCNLYYIT